MSAWFDVLVCNKQTFCQNVQKLFVRGSGSLQEWTTCTSNMSLNNCNLICWRWSWIAERLKGRVNWEDGEAPSSCFYLWHYNIYKPWSEADGYNHALLPTLLLSAHHLQQPWMILSQFIKPAPIRARFPFSLDEKAFELNLPRQIKHELADSSSFPGFSRAEILEHSKVQGNPSTDRSTVISNPSAGLAQNQFWLWNEALTHKRAAWSRRLRWFFFPPFVWFSLQQNRQTFVRRSVYRARTARSGLAQLHRAARCLPRVGLSKPYYDI